VARTPPRRGLADAVVCCLGLWAWDMGYGCLSGQQGRGRKRERGGGGESRFDRSFDGTMTGNGPQSYTHVNTPTHTWLPHAFHTHRSSVTAPRYARVHPRETPESRRRSGGARKGATR
jgi:hypothetical protein